MKDYRIKSIENGVVIDHIDAGKALKVLDILGIGEDYKETVTIAMNLPSKSMKKKDIVKVEKKELKSEEINKIAIIAPSATINWIRNFKVAKKEKVVLPKELTGVMKCPNPKCVTNKEREPVSTKFYLSDPKSMSMKCAYCEREIKREQIEKLI
jgi:aspartate carbamoyltransferase regulatory subunit